MIHSDPSNVTGHIPPDLQTAKLLFQLIALLEAYDSRLKFQPGVSTFDYAKKAAWVATSAHRVPGWWVALTPAYYGVDVRVTSPVVHDPLFVMGLDSTDTGLPYRELQHQKTQIRLCEAVREALDKAEAVGAAV